MSRFPRSFLPFQSEFHNPLCEDLQSKIIKGFLTVKNRGQVLNPESLSLPIRLSTFLRTFLSLAMVFEALRTAWDTADSLTLYPYCRAIISP